MRVPGAATSQSTKVHRSPTPRFHGAVEVPDSTRHDPELVDAVGATGLPVDRVEVFAERGVPVARHAVRATCSGTHPASVEGRAEGRAPGHPRPANPRPGRSS